MKNPFPDNPVFTKFLGIKNYFRQFTTKETVTRTKQLAKVARMLQNYGDEISFDILGSVNFGMAEEGSDVDLIMYLHFDHLEEATHENSYKFWFYERLILNTMLLELADKSFKIQVVDCINLTKLQHCIETENYDDDIITRFVFYRTICRGINKRVIRKYEKNIMLNEGLFKKIEQKLTEALVQFIRTSSHKASFEKYIHRLSDKDIKIPQSMLEKIREYLNLF